MDFRMDKASWFMLVFMFATYIFFMLQGTGGATLETMGYIQMILLSLLMTIVVVAISCIPVLIFCLITDRVPDIDYSIWVGTGFTLLGIISELI